MSAVEWPQEAREAVVAIAHSDRPALDHGSTAPIVGSVQQADRTLSALAPHVEAMLDQARAEALRDVTLLAHAAEGVACATTLSPEAALALLQQIAGNAEAEAERDALRARLAAVEALADEYAAQEGDLHPALRRHTHAARIRAALAGGESDGR